MKRKILTAAFAVAALGLAAFAAADLNGKWNAQLDFNGQTLPVTSVYKVDGEKLTGTVESPYGVSDIQNGKFKNDSLHYSINVQNIEIPVNGKFYGDSVGINMEVQGQLYHATLKRAK